MVLFVFLSRAKFDRRIKSVLESVLKRRMERINPQSDSGSREALISSLSRC